MKVSEIVDYTTWRQYYTYVNSILPKLDSQRRIAVRKIMHNCEFTARPLGALEHRYKKEKRELLRVLLENKVKSELIPQVRTLERILLIAKLTKC
jgi:hypothetical protein